MPMPYTKSRIYSVCIFSGVITPNPSRKFEGNQQEKPDERDSEENL